MRSPDIHRPRAAHAPVESGGAKTRAVRGTVFDIQSYSIHDGPGIRTTVFLKGCPLRCEWCQNPESQARAPQLMSTNERCPECADSGVADCPHEVKTLVGSVVTAGEVFDQVAVDGLFYARSGGGVTVSGGEPLTQPAFAEAVLRLSRQAGFHTAVDTAGHAPWPAVKRVLAQADLVLYDLKHMDDEQHRRVTGVTNKVILENAVRIRRELGVSMWVRIPLIPCRNDQPDNLAATARFVADQLGTDTPVHLLPYHRMGVGKAQSLGWDRDDPDITPPTDEAVQAALSVLTEHGLNAVVGGG
jgi:pyruvate formate lyase activating enzyme